MSHTAVVILNYNGEKLLQKFLPTVLEFSNGAEIVVADNASTDQSIAILKRNFPTVRLVLLDQNYGFCGGYNRALQEIKADYYVLLNSDIEVTAGWLAPLITLLENNRSVAAVQPKILSYHQKNKFEHAGAAGGFIDSLGYPFCRGRIFDHIEEDKGQYNDEREIFWTTGACMVIRSEAFHRFEG
ncbi:MAG: dTDP-Rha--alpha-D-GlcNAc-pyrophosphate polyprenol alpha-3-L-rhamnosyltransferase, partial [Marivirga sp.]|nr:dTDP-Rha--alpha-D-GlcNAc-pyrophosphate polyprenol alpha-3-L-rhamnosyltransferase [Marivirga sp.]